MRFKLWPSGHSEDYTLIATFGTPSHAEEGERNLQLLIEDMKKHEKRYETDWSVEDASISRDGNVVHFYVYSAGYLDDVSAVLQRPGRNPKIEIYQYYQELTITIPLPENAALEHYMLIAGKEESAAIKELRRIAKLVVNKKGTASFEYAGDKLYDPDDSMLYLGDNEMKVPEGWQIGVTAGEGN